MIQSFRPRTGSVARFAFLLWLLLLAGCGRTTCHLSGRVLYNGDPLPGGRITFLPSDSRQNPVPALIDAEGHYDVTLPVGEVTIIVDNRELKPVSQGPPPELPGGIRPPGKEGEVKAPVEPKAGQGNLKGKYVWIPERYSVAEKSELKHTVKPGTETHDIELK